MVLNILERYQDTIIREIYEEVGIKLGYQSTSIKEIL